MAVVMSFNGVHGTSHLHDLCSYRGFLTEINVENFQFRCQALIHRLCPLCPFENEFLVGSSL